MPIREYIHRLEDQNKLVRVSQPISKSLQIAGVLKQCEPTPVLFEKVQEAAFPVIGNLFCSKASIADYFCIGVEEIIPFLLSAIKNRRPSRIVSEAACQEVVHDQPDLDLLPILFHCDQDGGNYISSGVVIANHPVHGQNADFHRCMQFSKTEMAVRVVRNRMSAISALNCSARSGATFVMMRCSHSPRYAVDNSDAISGGVPKREIRPRSMIPT